MEEHLPTYPLISVVIPSYNQGRFIEQTITSVLGQNYPNLELIVIDGGSTDQTQRIIEKYLDSISYYVSELDNGQAHAINKGFRVAKGDILAWLNSDDMYLPCTLLKVANIIKSSTEPKLIYGGCLHFYEGKSQAYGILPPDFDKEKITYTDYIIQPSTFWSRSLWEAVGELNEAYNYVLDWEWFIRAAKVIDFIPIQDYFSIYRLHETYKTGTGGAKRAEEIIQVIEAYSVEKWVSAYKDVYKRFSFLTATLHRSLKLNPNRFRRAFYLDLSFKYGRSSIDTALAMLC